MVPHNIEEKEARKCKKERDATTDKTSKRSKGSKRKGEQGRCKLQSTYLDLSSL